MATVAWPRLAAQWIILGASSPQDVQASTAEAISENAAALDQAVTLSAEPPTLQKAAKAHMKLARFYGLRSEWGQSQAAKAFSLIRAGLSAAPADSFGWEWLAYHQIEIDGASPSAAAAWRLSVDTGGFDPSLMYYRLGQGLRLWPQMDGADRAAVERQLFLAWAYDRGDVVEATATANGVDLVRPMLAHDPATLAEFERVLAIYRRNHPTPPNG